MSESLDSTVPITPEIRAFWDAACAARTIDPDTPFQAWFFADSAEVAARLLTLVLTGTKTATSALVASCEASPAGTPVLGGYSVVTDFQGRPGCVIRTVELRALPFRAVDAAFARDEGEGDRTLAYWRDVHWQFFARECEALGIAMSEDLLVYGERFEVVWAPSGEARG